MIRLISCNSEGDFVLERFPRYYGYQREEIPLYAILSHTWGADDEEITFEDIMDPARTVAKRGYEKLRFCRDRVAKDGMKYFWIDTCCIDKSNDMEHNEAITDMFQWYQNAQKCYVYLDDFDANVTASLPQEDWEDAFKRCRWFERGWTLQELLAPAKVEFYSQEGKFLGDKKSLERIIQDRTDVEVGALRGAPLSSFSVDRRLAWAENRCTKVEEDKYYSLMGIFDAYLYLKYGEGVETTKERLLRKVAKKAERRPPEDKWPFRRGSAAKSFDKERLRDAILKSLRFEQINDRYSSIEQANADTCGWFFNTKEYLQWLGEDRFYDNLGLLWLKGRPGTGKSTMMKCVLAEMRASHQSKSESSLQQVEEANSSRNAPATYEISFFFNARGHELERTIEGMYRSLLYQLLTRVPSLQEILNKFDISNLPTGKTKSWHIDLLRDMFAAALRALGDRKLIILVDALDECDENQVRLMIKSFEHQGEDALAYGKRVLVLFSSRDYPRITCPRSIQMTLEDQREYNNDIARYISTQLRMNPGPQRRELESLILQRSGGVFIWVTLVIRELNRAADPGRIRNFESTINAIPTDLDELFMSIMAKDPTNHREMVLCLQLVLLSTRPLQVEELYYALLADLNPSALQPCNHQNATKEEMERFILDSSKGFVVFHNPQELSGLVDFDSSIEDLGGSSTVQFIHEAVRDFLLSEKGKFYLQEDSTAWDASSGHELVKHCCLESINSRLAQEVLSFCGTKRRRNFEELEKKAHQILPCLKYAVGQVLYHAEQAAKEGISQSEFLYSFPTDIWARLTRFYFGDPDGEVNSSLLYMLAFLNLPNLVKSFLELDPDIDVTAGHRMSPISVAIRYERQTVLENLLSYNSKYRDDDDSYRRPTPDEVRDLIKTYHDWKWSAELDSAPIAILWFFLKKRLEAHALILLQSGRFDLNQIFSGSCLIVSAAAYGNKEITAFLLGQKSVDFESCDAKGQTALSKASENGYSNIVALLLASTNADVNHRSSSGKIPLMYAASEGHVDVVKILLTLEKTDQQIKDNDGRMALNLAASKGQEEIVELLLQKNDVDINCRDNFGQTPLIAASLHRHDNILEKLLRFDSIDVNAQDQKGRTALSYAAQHGYTDLLYRLGQKNVKIELKDHTGRTPLYYAVAHGKESMIQEFLQTKLVELHQRDNDGTTLLVHAITGGRKNIIKLLLRESIELKYPYDIHSGTGDDPMSSPYNSAGRDESLKKMLRVYCGCEECLREDDQPQKSAKPRAEVENDDEAWSDPEFDPMEWEE